MTRLNTLLKLKKTMEDRALRELQKKRKDAQVAEGDFRQATEQVQQSAAALPHREDRVYDAVLKKTVAMDAIDLAKEMVLELIKEHEDLINAKDRAAHVLERINKELAEAEVFYRKKCMERQKYTDITEEVKLQLQTEMEYKEEVELEDSFSGKIKIEVD